MPDETRSLVGESDGFGGAPTPLGPPRAAQSIQPGDNLGRYTVRGLIGAGGMGEVFAAHDPTLDRTVALKVIKVAIGGASPEARARFQREAQAMARLNHPNVVSVFDVGTVGDREEAHLVVQKALAILQKGSPRNDAEVAVALLQDAKNLDSLGRLVEARAAADQALALYTKLVGEAHPKYAEALNISAAILLSEGEAGEALSAYERSLAILEKAHGKGGVMLFQPLLGLADASLAIGDARRALAMAERAVVVIGSKGSPGDLEAAQVRIAEARWALGADRPGALALARETRARLAALSFPSEEIPDLDRWLASHRP